ncbi:small GTP-binding protein [Thiorhodococcus drewsii AZ1]|uniref:Small GTP-binding protein n=1 Tax=Thiorhodococcus drewsii AZ1 TaxID=765913 RepID=G2DX56_9GAMM|nr:[FeFe] hydrogenase H-cluster maturation GTPase HydF [Thiorhodococcus drewsii]EGV33410.1 small GTP-binding protein [Thiorhodococcus drewsii AZ1]
MLDTPKSLRLHIGIFGRRNAGKSSLINALLGYPLSIVSDVAGTTTDPVEKAFELPPIGPVVFVDTAGIDDEGALGGMRMAKTAGVLERVDLALLVCDQRGLGDEERALIAQLRERETPILCVLNKSDLGEAPDAGIAELLGEGGELVRISALEHQNIDAVKESIIRLVPEDYLQEPPLVADLIQPGGSVVLVVPIDLGAPKGRLILPQVQVIREVLDADAVCTVVKERELSAVFEDLRTPPSLVICDSQVVMKAAADTPPEVPLTTFSILMARFKADLIKLTAGAAMIHKLKPGDRVLIAEACTHDLICDDIGRVKIPRWLRQFVGGDLRIDFSSGKYFPEEIGHYDLIIQCGACMVTRKHMLSWLYRAERQGVPMTNYGVAISLLQGVLTRSLQSFPAAMAAYEDACRETSA